MKVSQNFTRELALINLQKTRNRYDTLSEQLVTGKRVNRPSDDPVAQQQSLKLESVKRSIEQYQKNISSANVFLAETEGALNAMSNVVSRIQEVAVTAANLSLDAESRNQLVTEFQSLRDELIDLGNTQVLGRYIFSGTATSTETLDTNGVFTGTAGNIAVNVDDNTTVTVNTDIREALHGVNVTGGQNIFTVITNVITAITTDTPSNINAELDNIDKVLDQILQKRTSVAGEMTSVSRAKSRLDDYLVRVQGRNSELVDADMVQVATEVANQESILQTIMATTSKIIRMSLLDFLG